MKVEHLFLYPGREDAVLTAYINNPESDLITMLKRPAVVIVPGGAYLTCTLAEGEATALKFVSMGYHAFVLTYTTYGGRHLPDFHGEFPPKKECMHPAPMLELAKGILMIREHAEEWLVDVDKVVLCGFSAGAHNVAMYCTNWHTALFREHFQKDSSEFRPAGAILGYTLSDYIFMKEYMDAESSMNKTMFKFSNTAFLGTENADDETLLAVSPDRNITEHTPPMFLWATAEDQMVPVQHTIRMAHALSDHKIPYELHIFENGPHGLGLATQASANAKSQIFPDAAKWSDLAGCWMERHFALELPKLTAMEQRMQAKSGE